MTIASWPSTVYEIKSFRLELTNKQAEALLLAHNLGFFQVPREAQATEIADRLEITVGSTSRRLRGAEKLVFEQLVPQIEPVGEVTGKAELDQIGRLVGVVGR